MKRIRSRLSYGNVVATLALFLALGGTSAFAASQLAKNSVGSKQLKANSVTTAKIKANAVTEKKIADNAITTSKLKDAAVTGQKINLATLGTVPSAARATSADRASTADRATTAERADTAGHASTADSAAGADRATTVDGQSIASFSVSIAENGPSEVPLAFGGITLTASCIAPKPNLIATRTSGASAVAQFFGSVTQGTPEGFAGEQANFSTVSLERGTFGAGTLDVFFSDGVVTTVEYAYRADTSSGGPGCRVYGKAITG
jgi:hypothetical protein